MTHPSLIERITRSLAYMLRHKPEEFDIELDRFGSADCNEVVQVLNERLGEPIDEEDLEDAIEAGDRARYAIKEGRVCALYGHSIEVDPGESEKPQELLYVGLGSRDAERAERYGLRAGRRAFLHLAKDENQAMESGRRQARHYAVVTVYALDAWEQGVNFYDRGSLYLSDPIPTEFLELGEVYEDGNPPTREGGRERGGRERGGRERGRDRDRDESRNAGQDGDREPRRSRRPERSEERPRPERPERSERSERPERSERSERPERSSRPQREERAPQKEAPVAEAKPARQAAPASRFGLGLEDSPPPVKTVPQPPKVKKEAPPAPPEPKASAAPSGPTFGSGL